MFERGGKRVVVYCHAQDRARLVFAATLDGTLSLDCNWMKYFETELSEDEVRRAFASAEVVHLKE